MDQITIQTRVLHSRVHYPELDSLRGLAALAVVFNHCLLFLPGFDRTILKNSSEPTRGLVESLLCDTPLHLFWQGQSAVMLFFVLSGFVLSLPWWRGQPQSYSVFLIRRVTRIYLPYLVAVGAAAALMVTVGQKPLPLLTAWFNEWNWEQTLTAKVALQHLAMTGSDNFIDIPIWSLVYEMRISVIFPGLMAAALVFGSRGFLACLAAMVSVYVATHLFHLSEDWIDIASHMVGFTALFVLGAFCARHVGAVGRFCTPGPTYLPAAMLCGGLLLLWPTYSSKTLVQVVPLGIGSALVVFAGMLPGRINATLHHPLPLWLGRVSFSLYLIHMPILLAVVRLTYGTMPVPVALVLGTLLSLVLSEGFHRAVERPCQQLGRRLTTRRVRTAELAVP